MEKTRGDVLKRSRPRRGHGGRQAGRPGEQRPAVFPSGQEAAFTASNPGRGLGETVIPLVKGRQWRGTPSISEWLEMSERERENLLFKTE